MNTRKTFKTASKAAKKNFILTIAAMAIFLFLMLSGKMLNGNSARISDHFIKIGESVEIPGEYRIDVKEIRFVTENLPVEKIKEQLLNDKLEPLFLAVISYQCEDLSGNNRSALLPETAGTGKEDGHAIPNALISNLIDPSAMNQSAFVFYYKDKTVQFKFSFTDSEGVLHNIYVTTEINGV